MSYTDGACDEVNRKNNEFNSLLAAEHPFDPSFVRMLIEAAEAKNEERVAKILRTIVSMHAMETATNVKEFLEAEWQRVQAEVAKQKANAAAAVDRGSRPRAMTPPGTRVVAICNDDGTTVNLFGFGVYQGDKPCPYVGGVDNPYIQMDDGSHMWGCICWWGPEDVFNASEEGKRPRKMVKATDPILGPAAPHPTVAPAGEGQQVDAALAAAMSETLS
jgi:hypothetical protein